MKPSEVLAAGRDYIAAHGWAQDEFTASDGRVCAMMGVRLAGILAGATGTTSIAALDALEEVALELTGYCDVVPVYNDLHCHDVQDVYNWIEKAICQLQERGE